MSNIKIDIIDNGITTLATAGKYCDRNVDIEVNVPSSGGGGGDIEVEPIVLTGNCNYSCCGSMAGQYFKLFGDTISTKDISNASYMFLNNSAEIIPFDINIQDTASSCEIANMFNGCNNLKELPKIKGNGKISNSTSMFEKCYNLREIPNDYFDGLNISHWATATSIYNHATGQMFGHCHSLRYIPLHWFNKMNPLLYGSYTYLYYGFFRCYVIDELKELPIPFTTPFTSSVFSSTFTYCHRLKEVTFQTNEDGSPLVKQWKSQTMDMSSSLGYTQGLDAYIVGYNSGITMDKKVVDDATYQALKNDPDWWAYDYKYSRYNHDSAVNTINSLPDTSAYLATAGGTNTIKFRGDAGSKTDGGAINTMTEEEIAVATAKGWTVTFI